MTRTKRTSLTTRFVFFIASIIFPAWSEEATQAAEEGPAELVELQAHYQEALNNFADQLAAMQTERVAQAIQELSFVETYHQGQGELDAFLAAKEIRTRIETEGIPEEGIPLDERAPHLATVRERDRGRQERCETFAEERPIQIERLYAKALEDLVVRLTRMNRLDDAAIVSAVLDEVLAELAAIDAEKVASGPTDAPPAPTPDKAPLPADPKKEKPNLFPGGDFENTKDYQWAVDTPSDRSNGTKVYTEPFKDTGGQRNRTIRMDQATKSYVRARCAFDVKDQVYKVTFRSRLVKESDRNPDLEELPRYHVGFQISDKVWHEYSVPTKRSRRKSALAQVSVPVSTEWRTHTVKIHGTVHMNELVIQAPPGRDQWLIDDIKVELAD